MGVAAAAVGVVGTVAGIAQRNSQYAYSRRAARLQQEANQRAQRIRELNAEAQKTQVRYANELEKRDLRFNSKLVDIQLQTQQIAERVEQGQIQSEAQFAAAQAALNNIVNNYESLRVKDATEQQLLAQEYERTQQAGSMFGQLRDVNTQIQNALAENDMNRAVRLAQRAAITEQSFGIQSVSSEAGEAYDEATDRAVNQETLQNALATRAFAENVTTDLAENAEFDALIRRATDAQHAYNLAQSNIESNVVAGQASVAGRNAVENIRDSASLTQQGRDINRLATESGLLRSDINRDYSILNIDDSVFASAAQTGARNAAIEASIGPRPSLLGNVASLAGAALPFVQGIRFGGSSPSVQQPVQQPPLISDFPNIRIPPNRLGIGYNRSA